MGFGAGKRSSRDRSNFKAQLLQVSNAIQSPDRRRNWCPIASTWFDADATVAAHIFAYSHGQDTMDSIFGVNDEPELFSPYNGILMSKPAQELFDKGLLVLVPDVPDDPTQTAIEAWHEKEPKEPKEYKTRICNLAAPEVQKEISDTLRQWKDLDGMRVTFRSDFRPRSQYLYFHYCCSVLRNSWKKDHFSKLYWETPGKFMPRNMLLAFVEELGHEYEALLEGAAEPIGSDEVQETALVAANNQIRFSIRSEEMRRNGVDEYSDDEDDEDETDAEENEVDEEGE